MKDGSRALAERENEDQKKEVREIKLDIGDAAGSSRDAWLDALKELEGAAPRPREAPRKQAAEPRRQEKPAAEPEHTFEELVEEAAEAIDRAKEKLTGFQKQHPYLFAPNIIRHWQESLKETRVIIEREAGRAPANDAPGTGNGKRG